LSDSCQEREAVVIDSVLDEFEVRRIAVEERIDVDTYVVSSAPGLITRSNGSDAVKLFRDVCVAIPLPPIDRCGHFRAIGIGSRPCRRDRFSL